jgi:hypothetical protein
MICKIANTANNFSSEIETCFQNKIQDLLLSKLIYRSLFTKHEKIKN